MSTLWADRVRKMVRNPKLTITEWHRLMKSDSFRHNNPEKSLEQATK